MAQKIYQSTALPESKPQHFGSESRFRKKHAQSPGLANAAVIVVDTSSERPVETLGDCINSQED
jgi:hypothetical protein